jgi:hypothetical protein
MREDTVAHLRQPGAFSEDTLTEVLRLGARRLLGQAVEMEVRAFVEGHAEVEQTQLNSALVKCQPCHLSSGGFSVKRNCSG